MSMLRPCSELVLDRGATGAAAAAKNVVFPHDCFLFKHACAERKKKINSRAVEQGGGKEKKRYLTERWIACVSAQQTYESRHTVSL